jgi:hypothetical protein
VRVRKRSSIRERLQNKHLEFDPVLLRTRRSGVRISPGAPLPSRDCWRLLCHVSCHDSQHRRSTAIIAPNGKVSWVDYHTVLVSPATAMGSSIAEKRGLKCLNILTCGAKWHPVCWLKWKGTVLVGMLNFRDCVGKNDENGANAHKRIVISTLSCPATERWLRDRCPLVPLVANEWRRSCHRRPSSILARRSALLTLLQSDQ